jgi:hypothetical protein
MVNENYKQFDILRERLDEIVDTTQKAVSSLNTIYRFSEWVNNTNIENRDPEEINSIYEDFVQSNEHIIEKINKILYPPPPSSNTY